MIMSLKDGQPVRFAGFIVAESTVRWFVVREKQMAADSADKLKRTRQVLG
jgi:uncharacterized protein YacL